MSEQLVHKVDGGRLISLGVFSYSYFDAEVWRCEKCGRELEDANHPDQIISQEDYQQETTDAK